ncbi:MAG: GNAT family N-acetyltransferase [Deltaproteobacteria bacterium]|nr:MAG: GNAT family N-acetyltransferase [Deltaproteobacteria bacterium]
MSLDIVDPILHRGWDDVLVSSPDSSVFHSSGWARVLSGSYGYIPRYFASFQAGKIFALLPVMEVNSLLTGRRGISLPFSDYCDPLVPAGIPLESLMAQIIDHAGSSGWQTLEIRCRNGRLKGTLPSSTYYGHILPLTGSEEQVFSRFRESTKRNIRNAIQEGVTVSISRSPESLAQYYRLHCLTRTEHGLPPQPFRFFRNIHRHMLSEGLGFTVLASFAGTVIAGSLYLHLGDRAYYKYGASDRNFRHLRANNLMMWEAIRWFARNGYKTFCFGRTEEENEGLRQFKKGWGTNEEHLHYYKYDLTQKDYVTDRLLIFGFHNKVFRKMPVFLSRIAGSLMYRHMA